MSRLKSILNRKGQAETPPETVEEDPGFDRWYAQDTAEAFRDAFYGSDWVGLREHYTNLPTWQARGKAIGLIDFSGEPVSLNKWIDATNRCDPLPLLIRGRAGVKWAWAARGGGWSDTVGEQGWIDFFDRLRTAEDDLHRAARFDPENPLPWVELLNTGRGLQVHKDEIELRFENLFRRDPANVRGHSNYVQAVAGKWSGDDERMWNFALDVHNHLPAGSPLRTVVAEAFIERYVLPEIDQPSDVRAIVAAAADQSIFHPDFAHHDPLDQSHALTWFCSAFSFLGDDGRGARAVELTGNRPDSWGLIYMRGKTDRQRWDKLRSSFKPAKAA